MTRSFTTEDFARRMERAAAQAADAGLTGVLVTPGDRKSTRLNSSH